MTTTVTTAPETFTATPEPPPDGRRRPARYIALLPVGIAVLLGISWFAGKYELNNPLLNAVVITVAVVAGVAAVHLGVSSTLDRLRGKRSDPGAYYAAAWLLALLVLALLADNLPFVRHYETQVTGGGGYAFGVSNEFWFGSDALGRDVFARCLYAGRVSLTIAGGSILVGLLAGGTLGLLAGYFRGWVDRVIAVLVDSLLALPALVVAAVVVGRMEILVENDITVLGFGFGWITRMWSVTIVLSILSIAPVARIVRAQTLSLAQREYVLAARSLGAPTRRILMREIVPNVIPALVAVIFTGVAILLAAESALAFLGLSVTPPQPSWGQMIADAREDIDEAWWATIFPCLMLFGTVLSFNLLGDRLARRFDIKEAAL